MVNYNPLITSAPAMSEQEAAATIASSNLWELSLQDRWRLYQCWVKSLQQELIDELMLLEQQYSQSVKKLAELRSLCDVEIMRDAKVIGMTTTGAAMHQAALRALKPRIVIVEEAAEVLEAHLLASLTVACEHCILIGDHKQLRPNPAVYELAKKYNLEISLFERLINNNYPYRMLSNQHRMRPEISRTLMPHFYPDLRDDASVADLPHVLGVTKDLLFISHHESEVVDTELKSHSNPFEAEYCIKLANYFVQQGYRHDQITVLCTYLDQLLELRKLGKKMFGFDHGIRIENVDNYQGEECNIIILSLVRSNNPDNRIGFLNIPNRVCVALSRAQIGLYVVANFDFLAANCELWKNIKQSVQDVGSLSYGSLPVKCQMHGTEQSIESLEDFEKKCPEGGCNQLCGARMDCGHTCWKPCHAYDLLHKDPCKKPCAKVCSSELQHPCKKKCSEECGACLVLVDKTLPCGHSKRDACHLPVESVFCIQACKKVLPCGHPCKLKCGQDCSAQKCSFPVTRVLTGCGHNAQMACSTPPSDFKCVTIVEKKWPTCNHLVETVCSMDVENTPCPKPCKTELPDCGHLCMGTCGQCRNGRIHIQCKKDCKRILVCGHECGSKCSKVCPPCEQICQTACAHSQCSRVAIPGHGQQKKSRKGKKGKGGKEVGRICGDPCPPCAEPCLNQCEHRKCTEFCWRPCNVEPCNQPCQKLLPCSPKFNVKKEEKGCMDEDDDEQAEEQADSQHFCIGVCGEDCPNICKICQPEEYGLLREIFFGREDEPDAKFIQLVDCGHILELSAVDDWIKSKFTTTEASDDGQTETMELVQINCPLCKTPIRRSKRYISLLNKRACDLEQVKYYIRGQSKAQLDSDWESFKQNQLLPNFDPVIQIADKVRDHFSNEDKASQALSKLYSAIKKVNQISVHWLNTAKNLLSICKPMIKHFIQLNKEPGYIRPASSQPNLTSILIKNKMSHRNFKNMLLEEIVYLVNRLCEADDIKFISQLMIQQIDCETKRFGFLVNLTQYLVQVYKGSLTFESENNARLDQLLEALNGNKSFEGEHSARLSSLFEEIRKSHPVSGFNLTEEERLQIIQSAGLDVTRWYKCKNGHIYGIGDCGQASQASRCPTCNEAIGGANHRLADNNQLALEMTAGVPPPAPVDPFMVLYH